MYQSQQLEGDGGAFEHVARAAPAPASGLAAPVAASEEETPPDLMNSDEEESEAQVTLHTQLMVACVPPLIPHVRAEFAS